MSRFRWFAVAAATLTLGGTQAGAASAAPALSTPLGCWVAAGANPAFPVVGSGFPPLSGVVLEYASYGPQTDVTTSSTGAFTSQLAAATLSGLGEPTTELVEAREVAGSGVQASFSVPLINRGGGPATPNVFLAGPRASRRTPWKFGGYPGATIFAHFSYSEPYASGPYHYFGTTRFGPTVGPCGTLSVRRPLFQGIKLRIGWWHIEFDTSPSYHRPAKGSRVWCGETFGSKGHNRTGSVVAPRRAFVVALAPCSTD